MRKIIKQVAILIVSLFILSFLTFSLARLAPGDPLVSYYGDRVEKMSEEQKEQARTRLGLDESIVIQYGHWVDQVIRGDLGLSFKYKKPVSTVIEGRIGNTLLLGGLGFIVLFVTSLWQGILCAIHEKSLFDRVATKFGTILACVPEFWLCLLLILVFSVNLRWFPSSSAYSLGHQGDIPDRLWHLFLPVSVIVISHVWYYAHIVRNKMITELKKDYVLLARANGLSIRQIVWRHCLPNMLGSYLALMAVALPHLVGGTYIVEMVFSYPGLGTLAYESARYHDYNLLMVTVLMSGALIMIVNLGVNMLARRIDPKIDAQEVLLESEGEWV